MILDSLDQADRHAAGREDFARAFSFLRQEGLANLPPGRHEVDGDRVYAVIGRDVGRGRQAARLEAHRKYIDIQFVVAGHEVIGWEDLRTCRSRRRGYDREKDIEFFTGKPARWVTVPPGRFAILFPDDAHAPLAGEGPVHKVIVKVAADRPEKAC